MNERAGQVGERVLNLMPTAEEHPTDWYVLRGRARGGPYPYSMVHEGARGGLISKGDLVWRPGWVEWRDAGAVDGFFAATAADRDAVSPQHIEVPPQRGMPERQPVTPSAAPSMPLPGVGPTAAAANPDHVPFNYVVAHWRGEFSLAAALFGNGALVGLILLIAATILATILEENKVTVAQYAAMIVAMSVIYLVSVVWLLVGICRSVWRRGSRRDMDARSDFRPDAQSITIAGPPPPPPAPN
jgi:GYF domain 2